LIVNGRSKPVLGKGRLITKDNWKQKDQRPRFQKCGTSGGQQSFGIASRRHHSDHESTARETETTLPGDFDRRMAEKPDDARGHQYTSTRIGTRRIESWDVPGRPTRVRVTVHSRRTNPSVIGEKTTDGRSGCSGAVLAICNIECQSGWNREIRQSLAKQLHATAGRRGHSRSMATRSSRRPGRCSSIGSKSKAGL